MGEIFGSKAEQASARNSLRSETGGLENSATTEAQRLRDQVMALQRELQLVKRKLESSIALVQAKEQQYRELFDSMASPCVVTDMSGAILVANKAAGALFEFSPNRLVGKSLQLLIAPSQRKAFFARLCSLDRQQHTENWIVQVVPRLSEPKSVAVTVHTRWDFETRVAHLSWTLDVNR